MITQNMEGDGHLHSLSLPYFRAPKIFKLSNYCCSLNSLNVEAALWKVDSWFDVGAVIWRKVGTSCPSVFQIC